MNSKVTLDITLGGETRSIEFTIASRGDLAVSLPVFAARIGNGMKAHRAAGNAWLRNGEWVFTTSTDVLNRPARITHWIEEIAFNKSNHAGSKI